jgi:cellulose synthase/poly-beta-1,6-N-acetylglucosamine synthase-like glycosyltransferase
VLVPRPRVSILLPVRDAAGTLQACLRSIARQRLEDWECVVVDDGSRDGSAALLREAAARDPRVRVLTRPRKGLVSALQAGLAACRGEAVARMDADDCMHRDRLAAQLRALEDDPKLTGVGCHVRLFPRAGLSDGRRAYESWLNGITSAQRVRDEAFVECPIAHPSLVIRREVALAFGYRDQDWPEDYDLVLRLLAGGHELGMVPRRLLSWRDSPGRLSRTDPRYGLGRFTACKAAFLALGLLAAGDHYVLWGHGPTGRALKKALAQHGKRPAAIVEVHPRRLGHTIDGAPVIAPEALSDWRALPLISAVSGPEPRRLIRAALAPLGYRESVDFACAA